MPPNTSSLCLLYCFRENNVCDINAVHGLFATGTIEVSTCDFVFVNVFSLVYSSIFFFKTFNIYLCVCVCILCEHVHACRIAYIEIGEQLTGVDFLLPYESWGLNSGCQSCLSHFVRPTVLFLFKNHFL